VATTRTEDGHKWNTKTSAAILINLQLDAQIIFYLYTIPLL